MNQPSQPLSELVDLDNVGSIHVGHQNIKIHPDVLTGHKRGNLMFAGFKGKMVFSRIRIVL